MKIFATFCENFCEFRKNFHEDENFIENKNFREKENFLEKEISQIFAKI